MLFLLFLLGMNVMFLKKCVAKYVFALFLLHLLNHYCLPNHNWTNGPLVTSKKTPNFQQHHSNELVKNLKKSYIFSCSNIKQKIDNSEKIRKKNSSEATFS